MALAFVPLYLKILGAEAFGLVGFFVMLQVWLAVLDLGMTPTMSREAARYTGGERSLQAVLDLLRTLEILALAAAVVIIIAVSASANWVALHWLQLGSLSADSAMTALSLMGIVVATRFGENLYRGAILGLQRHVALNVTISAIATVRGLGAVAALNWIEPTISVFFLWQACVSLVTLIVFIAMTYRSLPVAERSGRFSVYELRGITRFAGGIIGITFLATLLTQADKVLLSKLLSLDDFGFYSIAAVLAGSLFTLAKPINQTMFPRLCELHAGRQQMAFAETYHLGAQLVSVLVGGVAIAAIVFSEPILRLWLQDDDVARRNAPLLSLLMMGNLFNTVMAIPYQSQLACGWTSLTLKVNSAAVVLLIPAVLLVTPLYGAIGAACIWVLLNIGYIVVGAQFMFRRILKGEKWRWFLRDLLTPMGSTLVYCLGVRYLWPVTERLVADLAVCFMALTGGLVIGLLGADQLRFKVFKWTYDVITSGSLAKHRKE